MDFVMTLRRDFGAKLATAEMAMFVARSLVVNAYGEDELFKQGDLQLSETEKTWIFKGNRVREKVQQSDTTSNGDVTIEIAKFDCQILRFDMTARLQRVPDNLLGTVQSDIDNSDS